MASSQSADSFALVERFVGQPISRDDQGNVSELLIDAKVGLGSEIITDSQSSVTLLLPDGSRVDVGRNSAFKLGDDVLVVSDSFPDSSLEIAESDSSTAELDAELLQALIEAGADPTEIAEATAAGAPAAGGQSVVGGFGTISVSGIGVTTTPRTFFTTSDSTGQSIIPFVDEEGIAGSVDALFGGGLQNLAPQLGVLSFTISEDPDSAQALFSEGPAVSDPDNLTGDLTVIAVIPEQGSFFLADGTLLSEGPLELSGAEFNGLSFLPDPDANDELLGGPVSFDFVVIDPEGAGLPGSVTISVLPVEDAPVLTPDNVSIEEDSSTIQIDVLENDNDPDGDTLSVVSAEVDPSVGIVSVGENGIVSFTPVENYFGEAEITYGVTDGNTPIVFSTVQISVTGTNDPLSLSMSAPTSFTEGDATAGDEVATVASVNDPDGGDISYSVSDTTNYAIDSATGTVTLTAAGAAAANADSGASLPSFTVTATSAGTFGSEETSSTLSPSVTGTNDPLSLSMSAPTSFTEGDATAGDEVATVASVNDPDGGDISYSVSDTTNYAIDSATGTVTLTAAGAAAANADSGASLPSFTVTATSAGTFGSEETSSTLSPSVTGTNDPLSLSMSAPTSFTEGDATAGDEVATVASVNDPDGGDISYSVSDTTNYAIDSATGTVTLTAAGAAAANADSGASLPSFTVTATSAGTFGSEETSSTLSPSVTGTNDAPVANDDPGSPTLINFELGVSSGSSSISDWGVLNNLGQIEFQGDGIAGRVTGFRNDAASDVTFNSSNGLGVSGGNSEINLNEALRFDFDDPAVLTELTLSSLGGRFQNQEARVGWSAEQSDGTIVSGTFDQPTSNTETVELPGSLGSIIQLSLYVEATSEANFTVKAISGSASVDAIVLEEDSSVELLAADLLANDTDVDGDTLTINEINGQSVDLFNSAQADIAIDNGVLSFDGVGGITFMPAINFFGETSFEYQVSDGNGGIDTAEVAFRVRSINDAPEISVGPDPYNTNEDIPLVIPAGDISIVDVEDSDLTPSFSANNGRIDIQSNGNLLYTPEINWSGTDTITVTVVDSSGAEVRETFEVTVDPINDAPVANDDPVESFVLGGTNVESDWGTLSNGVYSFNSGGITGSISGSQDLSFQTGSNFGIGARGSEIDVNENVVFQFDSPVSNAQIGLGSLGSHYNAGSSQNARVIWEARDSDGNLVSQGEVRSDQANSDGDNNRTTNTIEIPESFSQLTLYTLANQNSNFTVQSFSADVANAQVIDAGDTLVADASSGVLANDTDPEGDDLTVIGVGQEGSAVQAFSGSTTVSGQYGTLTIDAEGSYQYQATTAQELSSGQQATDRFVYQISDGELDDTATLSFNVQGINDAPELALVANRVTQSAAKAGDEAATFSVTDPDNDAIGIEFDGTVPVDSEGNAIYTISADSVQLTQAGADLANQGGPLPEISLRASDGTLSDSASVTPSINQTPTISGSPAILGLQADYYAADSISNLEQFKAIVDGVPDASFVSTGLNYSVGSGDLGAGSNLQSFLGEDSATLSSDPADSDAAGLHLSGQIYLTAGDYQFFSYTDDGFELTVAGEQAGVFSGNRGPGTTSGNTITIDSDGWVDLEALWWDNGGQYVLQVSVAKGGGDPVLLVQDNFAFRSGENTILVETGAGLTGGGELSIADVDTSDEVTLMVQGSPSLSGFVGDLSASDLASMLTISTSTPNPILDTSEQSDTASVEFNSGSQTFSYLEAGQYLSITYTVVASDGASSSTYPVTIQILGSSGGQITGPSSSSPLIQAQSLTDTGLLAEYYGTNSGISNLDTFKALVASETPTSTFVSTGLDYEQRGGNLGRDDNLQSWIGDDQDSLSQNPDSTNKAGLFVKGQVYLEAGVYQFRTTTDDGFELSVNGRLAGQYASNTGARVVTGDPITVAADGWVDLEAYWWDNGGKYVLDVEVSKDNGSFESLNEESGFEFRHGPNLSLAETDGSLEETGSLQVSDPDAEESVLVQIKPDAPIQVVGEVGEITTSQLENMFALTGGDSVTAVASGQTSGQVEYQFNSGAETFSHLGAGDTLEITYTVEAFDGVNRVEHPVTIRIVGTGPSLNGSPTQVDSGNDYGWLNTPSGEIPSLWSGTELESSSASRSINALRFELSGIKNGADEVLVLDGNDIAMQDDETSISGDVQITVTQISSETFNIEVSTASGWTNSEASSLVDSIAFRHDGTDPETDRTEGVREIRLVEVSETTGSTETPTSTTQLSDVSVELYIGIPQIYGADGSYSNDFAGESDPFGSPQTAQDDLLVFSDMPAEAQAPDQNGVLADDVLLLAGGAGNDVFVAIDREFSSDGSASTTELGPIKAQISDFGLELDADNNLVANTEQDTLDLSQLLESNAGAIAELEVNGNGDAVISVTSSGNELLAEITLGAHDGLVLTDSVSMQDLIDENVIKLV